MEVEMTKEEYTEAYMKGAFDAWTFAKEHKENLEDSFLMVVGAASISQRILETMKE